MKRIHYNIEFAHIYTNECLNGEHIESARLAKKQIDKIDHLGQSYVLTVLIDDYNPAEKILDIRSFLQELSQLGVEPNYVVFESSLVHFQDFLLDKMNGQIKKEYVNYIDKHQKCPCSFLVAAWHLVRLGVFPEEKILSKNGGKPFSAQRVISILPRRYESVERKAIDIINSTMFHENTEKIEHIFF